MRYWGQHARGRAEIVLKDQILHLLFARPVDQLPHLVMPAIGYGQSGDCGPLDFVAYFGLSGVLTEVLQRTRIRAKSFERAMMAADIRGHMDICLLLIKAFSACEDGEVTASTVLPYAVLWERADIKEKLLSKDDIDVNRAATDAYLTALHYASVTDDILLAMRLIQKGADLNVQTLGGGTPLLCAQSEQMMIFLVVNGADVDARSQWNRSPLHRAAHSLYITAIRLLLDYGASSTSQTDQFFSPWYTFTKRARKVPVSKRQVFEQRNKAIPISDWTEEIKRIQEMLWTNDMVPDPSRPYMTSHEVEDEMDASGISNDDEFESVERFEGFWNSEDSSLLYLSLDKKTRDRLREEWVLRKNPKRE